METFTFKLASEPGIPNINGYMYSKESLDKMINSMYTKTLIEYKSLMITTSAEIRHDIENTNFYTPLENCIGYVTKWDGNTVEAKIIKHYDYIKENIDKLVLGMNYSCRIEDRHDKIREAIAMKISSFTLINKETGLPIANYI